MTKDIPESANRAIFSLLLLVHILALFVLPAVQAPAFVWTGLLFLMVWLTLIHWGLIHEAIHKLLFINPQNNEMGGRMLAIAMGTSFHALRFGHLMHHQLNRQFHAEDTENYSFTTRLLYYFHLLFGLYAFEVVMGILFLILPQRQFMKVARATYLNGYEHVAVAGERFFYQRGSIYPTRIDVALGLAIYTAAFYLAGPYWYWILGIVLVRGLVISFMDNIYHFATPSDNSKAAKELALPEAVSALMLYGNYHETHHTNPDVPWPALPRVHRQQQRQFDGGFITHGLKQFRGPKLAAG